MSRITIERFMELNDKNDNMLQVRSLTGKTGFDNKISSTNINRPGMNLFGYFEHFGYDRIQIFGRGESGYLDTLIKEARWETVDKMFEYNIPLCVFTSSRIPDDAFVAKARERSVPVFVSAYQTGDFIQKLATLLDEEFAPTYTVHGVFVEVFGIGVLLKGKSGVGKSETALELVERGHRLISDDSVDFKRLHGNVIIGGNNKIIKYNMELRGLGIIDIARISGMSAIRDKKALDLIITLEDWKEDKEYDRTGLEEHTEAILGIEIPALTIPVKPGRNIYILIETAAKNLRLKRLGYHAAKEFNKRIMRLFEGQVDNLQF